MATSGGDTFFARPVYLEAGRETFGNLKAVNGVGQRGSGKAKHARFASDLDTCDPPPRPPPPRPSRAPKQPESSSRSTHLTNGHDGRRLLPQTPHNTQALPVPQRDTHEPQPLTRLNVTSHEKLWQKETETEHTGPGGELAPPLNYITPETTQAMMQNFNPLDALDSYSEHSDSSADTMIMMTTEEERKNQEKISRSMKQFTSVKTKPDKPNTNRMKGNMQTKKNLHIHFSEPNTDSMWRRVPNGPIGNHDDQTYSKVAPLHIRTDNDNNGMSPESGTSKTNSNHGSPNDSPDDGYGTNSSSGTVSSPFSSSFGSNDLENSYGGSQKKVILPNGAIKPNSVRESWAVKRKQRMIESQDNSVQEQLRQLTVIEEEGGSRNMIKSSRAMLDKNLNRPYPGDSKPSDKPVIKNGLPGSSVKNSQPMARSRIDSEEDQAFVNVSQTDLRRINQQLYVISSEREAIRNGSRQRPERTLPQTPATNEIIRQRIPPQQSSADNVTYTLPQRRTNQTNGQSVNQTNGPIETVQQEHYAWESDSEYGGPNAGRMLLRGGSDTKVRTVSGSGNIYVSPAGDEGLYSLNRSSRSTSISSFQPINEATEASVAPTGQQGDAPRSPLEDLSNELLEKWSDMDRNYRNYYGFDENVEKYSRTDSKVNYFQEKKINTMYGQDNYYRPPNYGSQRTMSEGQGRGLQARRETSGQTSSQGSTSQGTIRDSKDAKQKHDTLGSKTTQSGQSKSSKDKDTGSKNKFFQILPNMFKPSGKKHVDVKDGKSGKGKGKKLPVPVISEPVMITEQKPVNHDYDQEAEYINMSDLPQYSVASVEYEEKLKKGQHVSMDSLNKRPVFASSRDIQQLFSLQDQSFDSLHSPGTQRHSFHAMPLSYRHRVNMNPGGKGEDMRPRASSTSATLRSQQLQNSVESRMALIARKNAAVMNQARSAPNDDEMPGASSLQPGGLTNQKPGGSRSRLNSGDSSGDSKLSTLV